MHVPFLNTFVLYLYTTLLIIITVNFLSEKVKEWKNNKVLLFTLDRNFVHILKVFNLDMDFFVV